MNIGGTSPHRVKNLHITFDTPPKLKLSLGYPQGIGSRTPSRCQNPKRLKYKIDPYIQSAIHIQGLSIAIKNSTFIEKKNPYINGPPQFKLVLLKVADRYRDRHRQT